MKTGLILFIALSAIACLGCQVPETEQSVSKNGMTVSWTYSHDSIHFKMTAPTTGWVTIGFNNSTSVKGNYLMMGRVVDGKAELIEHYTISAGNYRPITELGAKKTVGHVAGIETDQYTEVSFSLPLKIQNRFQKALHPNTSITLLLAYSRADDFQHHSMMRTHIQIVL